MADSIIGEEVLLAAMEGHIERLGSSTNEIELAMLDLGAVPTDVSEAFGALGDLRTADGMPDHETAAWYGGVLDGFVLGVRAARIAAGEGT